MQSVVVASCSDNDIEEHYVVNSEWSAAVEALSCILSSRLVGSLGLRRWRRSSVNQADGGLIPALPSPHAEVCLGRTLNPAISSDGCI